MTRQPLPLELACIVLQYLHNDSKTLKKCSLVHKSWRHEAQKLLFGRTFVRIGVPQDSRGFPLDKRGEKRSPSEFVARTKKSPHLIYDIRAIRINIADVHRIITSTRGDDAWTLPNVIAAIVSANKLGTLAFFSMDHLRDFYRQEVSFPIILGVEPLLEEHFSLVTRLEFQTPLSFTNLGTLQNLLCSLPALEEFFFQPLIIDSSTIEPINHPSNLSLRRLIYQGGRSVPLCWRLIEWLAITDSRHSLNQIIISAGYDMSVLQPLMGAITQPFSLVNLDANNCK
jgi:hypothetical protein